MRVTRQATDGRVAWLRDTVHTTGFSRAAVGISGGKDSAITAALLVRALGAENVVAIMVPCGLMPDADDARELCRALGLTPVCVPIGHIMRCEMDVVCGATGRKIDDDVREAHINATARTRMAMLRYVATLEGALLVGTMNRSEWEVGYFTKGADDGADIEPLLDLTCSEVVELGHALPEIPAHIVDKAPSDGLCGRTDEERIGATYAQIDAWLATGTCGDANIDARLCARHAATEHKRHLPPHMA